MLRFCGQRFRVDKRTEKICDTMYQGGSLRLPATVLLEDLRCDGSGHDGCAVECRLFWKEAWLQKPSDDSSATQPEEEEAAGAELGRLAEESARLAAAPDGSPRYRCQATEHFRASQRLRTSDPRPYLREYTSSNVRLAPFLKVVGRAVIQEPLRKLNLMDIAPARGTVTDPGPEVRLGLKPGDLVRVKSHAEIARTLDPDGKHRGIWWDRENVPYCGGTYRVRRVRDRYIDEHDGHMFEVPTECVTLEGVLCSGELSVGRWFCPRAFHLEWCDAWLERVPE
jgi:hypothetical protein